MTKQITQQQLESAADYVNIVAGFPDRYAEPAHLFVQKTASGYKLMQVVDRSGAARDALDTGPVTKRELHMALKAYGRGIAHGIDRGREIYSTE